MRSGLILALAIGAHPLVAVGQSPFAQPLLGARIGAPLMVAAYVGVAIAHPELPPEGGYRGVTVTAEAGEGGGDIAVGRGLGNAFGSMRYEFSLLRTWERNEGLHPNQTFLGVDGRLSLAAFGVELGAYARVSGVGPGRGKILVLDLVAGL